MFQDDGFVCVHRWFVEPTVARAVFYLETFVAVVRKYYVGSYEVVQAYGPRIAERQGHVLLGSGNGATDTLCIPSINLVSIR